eukprot:jgi/Chrzof1/1399/Cz10g06120.t1
MTHDVQHLPESPAAAAAAVAADSSPTDAAGRRAAKQKQYDAAASSAFMHIMNKMFGNLTDSASSQYSSSSPLRVSESEDNMARSGTSASASPASSQPSPRTPGGSSSPAALALGTPSPSPSQANTRTSRHRSASAFSPDSSRLSPIAGRQGRPKSGSSTDDMSLIMAARQLKSVSSPAIVTALQSPITSSIESYASGTGSRLASPSMQSKADMNSSRSSPQSTCWHKQHNSQG